MSTTISEEARISQITTRWDEIFEAHGRSADCKGKQTVTEAQQRVLKRYGSCVYRYLFGATRESDAADELSQEFALRFIRGDLGRADPTEGRFRDYLRVALRNLVNDHYRRSAKSPRNNFDEVEAKSYHFDELEDNFKRSWRREVLQLTWDTLEANEKQKGNCFYTVLRYRADHPELSSAQLAEQLSGQLGKSITAEWVRQKLHRARQKFSKLLVDEVQKTMIADDPDQLNEELADLQLLEYLQSDRPR